MKFSEANNYVLSNYDFKAPTFSDQLVPIYDNSTEKLKLICSNGKTINLHVYGDMSLGWMEFDDLDPYFGKRIVEISEGKITESNSGICGWEITTEVHIHFSDNECFTFVHRNVSNGYYANFFDLTIE